MATTAHVILSDRLPPEHVMKRLQWLWSHPGERSAEEQSSFLQRISAIDAGFPLDKRHVEQLIPTFPELATIAQTQPSPQSNTDPCPICRTTPRVDPLQIVLCGHVFCYPCLRAWSDLQLQLTCPLCRRLISLQASQFQRWAAPPQGVTPSSNLKYLDEKDVLWDPVRDQWLEQRLNLSDQSIVVISEWPHTRQRFSHAGSHVTFATLEQARQTSKPPWQTLVVLDASDPAATVQAFLHEFPSVKDRWYLATRLSVDHYLLSTSKTLTLEGYAEFLAAEILKGCNT